uniref:Uncharacterized protein n=1 Tax=Arundo donax TaxID=35708 RepID=A0A0A9BYT1_ARUDO
MDLYHIPKYVLSPSEKNPSTKTPCAETSVCPFDKDCPGVSELLSCCG